MLYDIITDVSAVWYLYIEKKPKSALTLELFIKNYFYNLYIIYFDTWYFDSDFWGSRFKFDV